MTTVALAVDGIWRMSYGSNTEDASAHATAAGCTRLNATKEPAQEIAKASVATFLLPFARRVTIIGMIAER